MKKLVLFFAVFMVLSSCQKEDIGSKYAIKSGVITITFTDGHVLQMPPVMYSKLSLIGDELHIVPNVNCPSNVQVSQILYWVGVKSYKVTSEVETVCQ